MNSVVLDPPSYQNGFVYEGQRAANGNAEYKGGFIYADTIEAAEREIAWSPNPGPQTALIRCPIFELLFGGARGGGKTDGMLGDFAIYALTYGRAARGCFFRRTLPQLEDAIRRSKEFYRRLGAVYHKTSKTWTFFNGATLKFRYLLRDEDAEEYRGQQFSWVCFEELTQWASPDPIDKIKGSLRSAEGIPCFFRATTNPGGAGHSWVKSRYISPAPLGYTPITDQKTQMQRVYIPSRLEHNPYLDKGDPAYRQRLKMVGNDALVRAWLEGSWDIGAGDFFDDVWAPSKQMIPYDSRKPFIVPKTWRLRRSFDWGSRKPASLGIWAESDGTGENVTGRYFYPGSLIRLGEWYTVEKDSMGLPVPDKGQKLKNEQLGERIGKISKGREWDGCVADPSIFIEQGGPSIYQKMKEGASRAGHALHFNRADNSRITGWQEVRDRLAAAMSDRPESPGLYVLSNCTDWLRTVPVVPRDPRRGDDVDSKAEDHAADETRYMCMAKSGGFEEVSFAA